MLDYSVINNKKDIVSKHINEDTISWLDTTFVIPNFYNFNVFVVTPDYIARPDLVSLDIYGDDRYTDLICKLNGLSNPFELNEGMKLILPTMDYLTHFYTIPIKNAIDKDINEDDSFMLVSAKAKKDKRAPNEALLNDSRFRIDQSNGIVIY